VRLVSLVRQRPDLTLVPPAALRLDLNGIRDLGFGIRGQTLVSAAGRETKGAPSWWTARALEGEVKPGFTKEQILKPAKTIRARRAACSNVWARY